jgi:hypothetical protein
MGVLRASPEPALRAARATGATAGRAAQDRRPRGTPDFRQMPHSPVPHEELRCYAEEERPGHAPRTVGWTSRDAALQVPCPTRGPVPAARLVGRPAAQMTSKTSRSSRVSSAETASEPRQPSRLEKRKNTDAGCPAGAVPNRGVTLRGGGHGHVTWSGDRWRASRHLPSLLPGERARAPGSGPAVAFPPWRPGRTALRLSTPGRAGPTAAPAGRGRPTGAPAPARRPPPRSTAGRRTAAWCRPARAARRTPR